MRDGALLDMAIQQSSKNESARSEVAVYLLFFLGKCAALAIVMGILAGPYFYLTGGPEDVARAWGEVTASMDAWVLEWKQYFRENPKQTFLVTCPLLCAVLLWINIVAERSQRGH